MDKRPHKPIPAIERFLRLTRINPGGCWDWLGSKSKDGYGQFILDGRRSERVRIAPYRYIWEYCNGPMPEGLEPNHTCNNRQCVNPQHIEPVTHSENQRRNYERGRSRPGRDYRAAKPRSTHCPHGHEFTPENSRLSKQNTIQCIACDRRRCADYQARKRAARA